LELTSLLSSKLQMQIISQNSGFFLKLRDLFLVSIDFRSRDQYCNRNLQRKLNLRCLWALWLANWTISTNQKARNQIIAVLTVQISGRGIGCRSSAPTTRVWIPLASNLCFIPISVTTLGHFSLCGRFWNGPKVANPKKKERKAIANEKVNEISLLVLRNFYLGLLLATLMDVVWLH